MAFNPRNLPSPFYRVSVRALAFDNQERILVVENEDHEYELPGGGWEHDEDFETAMRRELREEVGREVTDVGAIAFTYRGFGEREYWMLRLVAPVSLADGGLTPGDGMIAARYITRDEFLALPWCDEDAPVVGYAGKIWSLVEKEPIKR